MDMELQSAFLAELSTLLILLAGAILLYRSFREKYLVPWLAGWITFGFSKLFGSLSGVHPLSSLWLTLANVTFALTVGLFCTAVFLYLGQKKLLLPTALTISLATVLGLAQGLWFPQVTLLYHAFIAAWAVVIVVASLELVKFAWGRRNTGLWILALMLILLHMDVDRTPHVIVRYDMLVDLLLGISMMMIVLDDSRVQVKRLNALNTINHRIVGLSELPAMAELVIEQLQGVMGAKSGCFRVMQNEDLVLLAYKDFSPDFLRASCEADLAKLVAEKMLPVGDVCILRTADMAPEFQRVSRRDGVHHLVLIPVNGKNATIGVLSLVMKRYRIYTADEKSFLKAAANHLGLTGENRQLVQQLVRSRNEWAGTFNSIPDYILVHDSEYRILRVNRALLNRLQLSRVGVINQTCEAVLPGAQTLWKRCPYCEAEGTDAGGRDICFGGFTVVSSSAYTGEDSTGGTVHVIKDVSEAHDAKERYKTLFDHMREGVFVSTPEGMIVDCNQAFVAMLGYSSKNEVLSLDAAHTLYVDMDDRKKFLAEMTHHGFVRNFEYPMRRKDGTLINVIESSFMSKDATGQVRYQGVVLDVTDMKHAEDEIRRRNRELRTLNNIASAFTQSFDLDEILQAIMHQIVDLFGTDTAGVYEFDEERSVLRRRAGAGHKDDWFKTTDTFPIPPEFVEAIRASHTEIIRSQDLPGLPEIVRKVIRMEGLQSWLYVILWRKEKILGVLATGSHSEKVFSPADENLVIAVGQQLATTIDKIQLYNETKRAYENLRRTQEQLLQSEKMSAVGQLISGVAHELNNPLTAIIGYSQLLETENLDDRSQEFVQKLHKQAQRTQRIVQNLLSFARQHKPQRMHVDLRSVLENTLALRDYDLKINNIVVEREFQAALPGVVADPHQIEQVYLNIINNAADAMMDRNRGGVFRIKIYTDNGHVVSEFHDSGPGLTDPKRVFDPFYTTKGIGKGTGLGLSICYGIVKEHNGEISASNHPNGGALLEVRIPASVGDKPMTEQERIEARRESQLEGMVLLIDDEEVVLDFEREVLVAAGLNVVAVTSGAEAIDQMQQQKFDAIFLDSKLPGTYNSEDIYCWMKDADPELARKTVLVLSNVSDPSVRAFVETNKLTCLVKPFEVADLMATTRRLLSRVKTTVHS